MNIFENKRVFTGNVQTDRIICLSLDDKDVILLSLTCKYFYEKVFSENFWLLKVSRNKKWLEIKSLVKDMKFKDFYFAMRRKKSNIFPKTGDAGEETEGWIVDKSTKLTEYDFILGQFMYRMMINKFGTGNHRELTLDKSFTLIKWMGKNSLKFLRNMMDGNIPKDGECISRLNFIEETWESTYVAYFMTFEVMSEMINSMDKDVYMVRLSSTISGSITLQYRGHGTINFANRVKVDETGKFKMVDKIWETLETLDASFIDMLRRKYNKHFRSMFEGEPLEYGKYISYY